jgi:TolB-like protein/tetratricopeptide (TPR) repeat protein/predicted Ser/Thr protein kinase
MIGRTISHYRIIRQLGRGGMGEVYEAEDLNLRRRVALKILPPEVARDEERLRRFQREAETLARLNHPRIVTIYSVEEADGVRFLTMEYVEGSTLREAVRSGGLPIDRLVGLARQLSEALAAAHERGVLHRDLKPENVLLDRDGQLKVLDFGLAKSGPSEAVTALRGEQATLTIEGQLLGTVPYMSPEQAEGRSLDERSDIFSLGVMLYELATGERPFAGDTQTALLSAILRDAPVPLGDQRPDLPSGFRELIERCLEKDPVQRPQSAGEVLEALDSVDVPLTGAAAGANEPTGIGRRPRLLIWAGSVVALLVLAVAIAVFYGRRKPTATQEQTEPIQSIAVLPLENLSGDPAQDYFADGMTEALITDLAKIGALRVISRTSVMRYKDTEMPMRDIGQELNVDAVLEGSVMRAGGRVRITTQLIDARTDTHLWAESYDREARDVLRLQSTVAQAVADEIRIQVTPEERRRIAAESTVDPKAHELYLRGMEAVRKAGLEGPRHAADLLEEAVRLDPGFALAYAGLARAYAILAYSQSDPRSMIEKARQTAQKAMDLRPDLATPYFAMGYLDFVYAWDWDAAEREFNKALSLSQGEADSRIPYSLFLLCMGRLDEARAFIDETLARDPLSPRSVVWEGWVRFYSNDLEGAQHWAQRGLQLDANYLVAHWLLGRIHLQRGELDQAIEEMQRTADLSGRAPVIVGTLGYVLARDGKMDQAMKLLEEPTLQTKEGEPVQYASALVHTGAGDHEKALDALEEALERRATPLTYLGIDPIWDDLRGEPRFQAILRKMRFPLSLRRRSERRAQQVPAG